MYRNKSREFSDLIGETLVSIEGLDKGSDQVIFTTASGKKYKMYHQQDCCENVEVEDVCGVDIKDLLDTPIVHAEESSRDNLGDDKEVDDGFYPESQTWTFYLLSTIKGSITIRWLGTSNGYYSESVDFEEM